jgi:nicotinamide riboside kinase
MGCGKMTIIRQSDEELALSVDIVGGPGEGKSTTAMGVAKKLKMKRVNVEYVPEYAKGLTWEERIANEDQEYIFSKQSKHIKRCAKAVDVVVVDSPLILSLYYGKDVPGLKELVMHRYNEYDHLTYLITRGDDISYQQVGRNQTQQEARTVHEEIIKVLDDNHIPRTEFTRNHASQEYMEHMIVKDVLNKLGVE